MIRRAIFLSVLSLSLQPTESLAQSCSLQFTVVVTQGVGFIAPGSELHATAEYTLTGETLPQESGAVAWLASGEMRLGDDIAGPIWTIMAQSGGPTADLMGVYANRIEGLSFAGVDFTGPMALTLFGRVGTLDTSEPPTEQAVWDSLDLRRAFALHSTGNDMLAGDVTGVTVNCR